MAGRTRGTTAEFDFEEHPEGTVVRLREHGYPDTPEGWAGFQGCSTGWGEALTLLELHVEHGVRH
ncbi:MAG TPA: SRPBCC domain-containing protein [Gaiellaceae bacterium]|nr:SRPBCC domain-containing protein [Gaiellaceae bacterium]